jgi:hypothetical protein
MPDLSLEPTLTELIGTLTELIEFVDGKATLDALTLEYAQRALRKLQGLPSEQLPRRRPHGPQFKAAEIIPFPQKRSGP